MDNIGLYIENFIKKNQQGKNKTSFVIKIGKSINENCFNINTDRIKFYSVIKDIKNLNLADDIKYNNIKRYLNKNLQLDCYSNGIQKCSFKKPKDILDISIGKRKYDLRLIAFKLNTIPSHVFPCKEKYNNISNIESIIFEHKLYKVLFEHIYYNENNNYQISINISNNINESNLKIVSSNIIKILKILI